MQWGGNTLINLRLQVCSQCLDRPQEQLRAIIVGPDPVPVQFPLIEPFLYDETTGTTQSIGQPVGLQQYAISPLFGTTHYGVEIPLLSVTANATTTVTATCRSPHGLATNDQISVEGLSNVGANGFFSVTVITATAFSWVTYAAITAGPLLTETTRLVTALVGLPLGVTTIPQVGP